MKKYSFYYLTAVFICSATTQAFSAEAVIGTKAKIVKTTNIVNSGNGLKFGRISFGDTGGTMTLPADENAIILSGDLISKGGESVDRFTISGQKNVTVTLSIPQNIRIYLGGNTGNSDPAKQMNINLNSNLENNTISFDEDNSYTFNVGGVLNVKPENEVGNYSANYFIDMSY